MLHANLIYYIAPTKQKIKHGKRALEIINKDGENEQMFNYDGVEGGKTGYTTKSRRDSCNILPREEIKN